MIVKHNDQDAALDAVGHEVIVAVRDMAELRLLHLAVEIAESMTVAEPDDTPTDPEGVLAAHLIYKMWAATMHTFLEEEADNA